MEYISIYTRKQAIADGELIDVSSVAREAGFKFPVAITHSLWMDYIQPDPLTEANGESVEGRLWDVLYMLYIAVTKGINRCPGSTDQVTNYIVLMNFNGETVPKHITLKSMCHPGDEWEPVITISKLNED